MICGDQNKKCTIVVATNIYKININNPEIQLVVQWDVLTTLDVMIQIFEKPGKDDKLSIFVFICPKWSNIKDHKELEQRLNKKNSIQLSNNHRPKAKTDLFT